MLAALGSYYELKSFGDSESLYLGNTVVIGLADGKTEYTVEEVVDIREA